MPSPLPFSDAIIARVPNRRIWATLACAALLPGWAGARAMTEFATVGPHSLASEAPNMWSIVAGLPWFGTLPLAGFAMAAAVGAAASLAAHFTARPPRDLLAAALLIALLLPGLLPGRAPIDFLLAGALGLALAARTPDRANLSVAALIAGGIALAFAGLAPFGAPPMIVVTVLIARRFFMSAANDNGLPLNPLAELPT